MASEAKIVGTGIMGWGRGEIVTWKKLQATQKILAVKSEYLRKIFLLV